MRDCGCHSHNGFQLSPEGLAQRELELPEVDRMGTSRYVDKSGSVSALVEVEDHWDDEIMEDQYRRFLSG